MPDCKKSFLFTSESVTEGHPDKVADQISDAVLDAILEQDPRGRVACETLVTTGMALIAGEITTDTYVDMPSIVRDTIEHIGYTDASMGFDHHTCAVMTSIDKQSADISQGVTAGEGLFNEQGAGDQGMMFGYATDETPELMPMPIVLAHKLVERLSTVRREGKLDFLRPDGKSQVSVRYEDGRPVHIDAVVVSTQHSPDVSYDDLRAGIIEQVINPTLEGELFDEDTTVYVNPTGRFVVGGPQGDCGLTAAARSSSTPTAAGDATAAAPSRARTRPRSTVPRPTWLATWPKNIVAAGLAKRCEVQLAYAIGVAEPVSVLIDTEGTETVPVDRIEALVREFFDLRPAQIIARLDLLRPIYRKTAAFGHFGRNDPDFTWERTDAAELLRKAAKS